MKRTWTRAVSIVVFVTVLMVLSTWATVVAMTKDEGKKDETKIVLVDTDAGQTDMVKVSVLPSTNIGAQLWTQAQDKGVLSVAALDLSVSYDETMAEMVNLVAIFDWTGAIRTAPGIAGGHNFTIIGTTLPSATKTYPVARSEIFRIAVETLKTSPAVIYRC